MNLEEVELQPWLFQVEPYPEESFGHFLGRFRRANCLSGSHLSAMLGKRSYLVSYWEAPSRRRRPEGADLNRLSQMTGVEESRFRLMWSPPGTKLHWPTRLCAQCYAAAPWHKLTWQIASNPHCEKHQRLLLTECPQCRSAFRLPSYWRHGACDRCLLPFHEMGAYQGAMEGLELSG